MRAVVKKILIASGILVVVGILLMTVAYMMGWNTGFRTTSKGVRLESSYQDYASGPINIGEIKSVDVRVEDGNITFKESNTYYIEYNYWGVDYAPEYQVKDGKLTFSDKNVYDAGFGMVWNFGSWTKTMPESNEVVIGLPKDAYLDVVSLKSNDNNMQLQSISCKNLTISGSYGNLDVAGITCDAMDVSWDDGNYSLKNSEVKDLNLRVDYGIASVSDARCDSLKMNISDGSLKTENVDFVQAEIVTDYSNVDMTLPEKEEAYSYDVKVEYGNITLNGDELGEKYQREKGDKLLQITTADGNVNIKSK